uniref:E3 ubiquitin protein ligase n=1 Tax=Albugo laibachii Nc14 TaxID=890382 RepID=F0VZF0_9STRA|nr:conserved hypothetical protein [Albugo laibachii Nc14]|eukprot:CCA14180.1 conserved hypothetical protein [Albugo laibachii Nc14]
MDTERGTSNESIVSDQKRKRLEENISHSISSISASSSLMQHHSPVKKMKLDDHVLTCKQANPHSLDAIKGQNSAMTLEIREKNRRIEILSTSCKENFQKRMFSEGVLLWIQRQWLALVDDLQTVYECSQGQDRDKIEKDGKEKLKDVNWINVVDCSGAFSAWEDKSRYLELEFPEWHSCIGLGEKAIDEIRDKWYKNVPSRVTENAMQGWTEKARIRLKELLRNVLSATIVPEETALLEQKRKAVAECLLHKEQLELCKKHVSELKRALEINEVQRHQACRDYDRLCVYMEEMKEKEAKSCRREEGSTIEKPSKPSTSVKVAAEDEKEKEVMNESNHPVTQELQKRIEELNNDVATLLNKLRTERTSVAELKKQLEQANLTKNLMEKAEASSKEELEAQIQRINAEKTHLNDEFLKIRHKTSDIESHIHEKWKKKLSKIQAEMTKLKGQVDEVNIKNASLREKLSSCLSFRDQLNELKIQHEQSVRNNSNLKSENERLRKQREESTKLSDRYQVNTSDNELLILRERYSALESTYNALSDVNMRSTDDAVAILTKTMKELEAQNGIMSNQEVILRTDLERLKAELEEVKANESICREENDALVAEIENITRDLESMRQSRKKLVQQAEDKRTLAKKLQSQLSKEEQAKSHCFEELTAVRLQVSSLTMVHRHQKATISSIKETVDMKEKEIKELKEHIEALESEKEAVIADRRKRLHESELASRLRDAEISMRDQQLQEQERRACTKCEVFKKKEQQYLKLQSEHSIDGPNTDSFSELERLELKDLQKIVNCSVCQDRRKSVIISKCYHMFCKDCIDSNLKARNRKCPSCKKMFGQDDVKSVWFT